MPVCRLSRCRLLAEPQVIRVNAYRTGVLPSGGGIQMGPCRTCPRNGCGFFPEAGASFRVSGRMKVLEKFLATTVDALLRIMLGVYFRRRELFHAERVHVSCASGPFRGHC